MSAAKRQRLSKALSLVPHKTFKKIVDLLHEDAEDPAAASRGYGKAAAQSVLRPAFDSFKLLKAHDFVSIAVWWKKS